MIKYVGKLLLLLVAAFSILFVLKPIKAEASEPFIAEIIMFGGNFAPRGWAFCNGQLLSISSNTALFSLLGTTYGGDGRTTFGLPDLRGRVAMHPGTGPGLTPRSLGQKGGAETHVMTVQQMPSHSHTAVARAFNGAGDQTNPDGATWAEKGRTDIYRNVAPDVDMHTGTVQIGNAGGSQAFSIVQPFQTVNFIIALVGVFPSRN
ncbi:MAG: phage tail protein [Sphingomonadales bacterium]